MSFFGFDPTGPPSGGSGAVKHLDFNDLEEEDVFNDDTFGVEAVKNLGDDFDFSGQHNSSNLGLKPAAAPQPSQFSYAQVAQASLDNDGLQPMASLWADDSDKVTPKPAEQHQTFLSTEEIESRLNNQNLSSEMHQQQQLPPAPAQQQQQSLPNPGFPQIPPQIAQIMYQPQIQQQILNAVASGRFPNPEIATQAMLQGLMSQMMNLNIGGMNNMNIPPPGMNMLPPGMNMPPSPHGLQGMNMPPQMQQSQFPQMQQPQQFQQPPMQPPMQQTIPNQQPAAGTQQSQAQSQPQDFIRGQSSEEMSQKQKISLEENSPSIEEALRQAKNHQHMELPVDAQPIKVHHRDMNNNADKLSPQQQPQIPQEQHQQRRQFQNNRSNNNYNQHNNNQYHHHNNHHNFNGKYSQQQLMNLAPEERERLLIRQKKVTKITKCSGFMTPKDKDFVTRFQLSQIVTDDPYNEDFYAQVYKVLNSNTNENNMNSLAQKYLEQSGHRLGGRSKRADIALQRMQQQVSKAVSVAKERGERTGILSKEGALGKVSFGSGKQPRKQLMIHTENETTSIDGNTDSVEKNQKVKEELSLPKEYSFTKSARNFQLSIIEKIYNEVLKLESLERENLPFETVDLWKSLHINDIIKTSSNDSVNPFISILSFDKMMKLFGRMFHFFKEDQKIELISQLFNNLSKIDIIMKSSYINYGSDNFKIPTEIKKKIDLFQLTILKCLVIYLSEADFNHVLNWLNLIVVNKSLVFLITTKIGLSLVTVLISRLELIKQEFSASLNAQELSQWQFVYNELFQLLEGRLVTCFPPYLSNDESKAMGNRSSDSEDDSYIWQFLASVSLAGMLTHQRVMVDEVRNEIFGVMALAKECKAKGEVETGARYLDNLNLFLNVMGLVATEEDITELSE